MAWIGVGDGIHGSIHRLVDGIGILDRLALQENAVDGRFLCSRAISIECGENPFDTSRIE